MNTINFAANNNYQPMRLNQSVASNPILFSSADDDVKLSKKDRNRVNGLNAYVGRFDEATQLLEKLHSGDTIDKQLRINEFLGITPKKYLNRIIAAVYADIDLIEAHLLTSEDFATSGLINGDIKAIQLELLNHRDLMEAGIEKLETVKKDRFGIDKRFDEDGNGLKKHLQKNWGRPNKLNRMDMLNSSLYLGGIVTALVLLPLAIPFIFVAGIGSKIGIHRLNVNHYRKAYMNEMSITANDVLAKHMTDLSLRGTYGATVEGVKRSKNDGEFFSLELPEGVDDSIRAEIEQVIAEDLKTLEHFSTDKQGVKIAVAKVDLQK